ncbi:MAG: hypothetical protein RL226_1829, partial [Bacteroidota bacterium]
MRVILGVLLAISWFNTNAAVRYVKWDAAGNENGNNWNNAFTTIEDAIEVAVSGDQIWVAAGTYHPRNNAFNYDYYFTVQSITFLGGFNGTETAANQRNPITNITRIDGDHDGDGTLANNSTKLFVHSVPFGTNPQLNIVLDGFLFTGVAAPNGQTGQFITSFTVDVLVRNCAFSGENGQDIALFIMQDGDFEVESILVENQNATTLFGHLGNGNITYSDCMFRDNHIENSSLINSNGNVGVYDCTFRDNSFNNFGSCVVNGIDGNLVVGRCDFTGNTFLNGSCVVDISSNSFNLHNSLFFNNISTYPSALLITGSSNIAEGSCNVVNNTFVGNQFVSASPIPCLNIAAEDALFLNNIVWGNEGNFQVFFAEEVSVVRNIIEGFNQGNNFSFDPQFIQPGNGNFRLSAVSPAINIGADLPVTLAVDLDQQPRIVGGVIDLGCYESQTCERPNDACSEATSLVVDGGPMPGSTLCATVQDETLPMLCFDEPTSTVWYSFVVPYTGNVHLHFLDIINSASLTEAGGINSVDVAVFSGSCNDFEMITCATVDNETITVEIEEQSYGETLYVMVATSANTHAYYTLGLELIENDCPADFNFDGSINTTDLLILTTNYGCSGVCTGDLNGDGLVGSSDMLTF